MQYRCDRLRNLIGPAIVSAVKSCLLALLISSVFLSEHAIAAGPHLRIYDGRVPRSVPDLSKAEEAALKKLVLKGAAAFWMDPPDFRAIDVAKGSFTVKGAKQTAFLYTYNSSGNNISNNGIAIVQNGKVLAHFGYQGGWERGIVCLPDLDGDGLNEVGLEGGFTNMGETYGNVSVLSLNPKKTRTYDIIFTFDVWDNTPPDRAKETGWEVFAVPGKTPKFEARKYIKGTEGWKSVGQLGKAERYDTSQPYVLLDMKRFHTIADVPPEDLEPRKH